MIFRIEPSSVHYQNASKSKPVALNKKITDPYFCPLLRKPMEVHIILDGKLTFLESFHEFMTNSLRRSLDIFVAKGDVHLRSPTDEIGEVGKYLKLIISCSMSRPFV